LGSSGPSYADDEIILGIPAHTVGTPRRRVSHSSTGSVVLVVIRGRLATTEGVSSVQASEDEVAGTALYELVLDEFDWRGEGCSDRGEGHDDTEKATIVTV